MENADNLIVFSNQYTDLEDLVSALVGNAWDMSLTTSLNEIKIEKLFLKKINSYIRNALARTFSEYKKEQYYTKLQVSENIKFGNDYKVNVLTVLILLKAERQKLLFAGLFLSINERKCKKLFPQSIFFYRGVPKYKTMAVKLLNTVFDTSIAPYKFTGDMLFLLLSVFFQSGLAPQKGFVFSYITTNKALIDFTIENDLIERIQEKIFNSENTNDVTYLMQILRREVEWMVQENLPSDINSLRLQQIKSSYFSVSVPNRIKCSSGEFFSNFLFYLSNIS